MHDASYHEIIQVRAPQMVITSLLDFCCESSASPGSIRYLTGSRACEALLYMPNSYPYNLIGPVTILWRPADPPDSDDFALRTVWVVCHPSIFESTFRSLTVSSSFAVEASGSHDKGRHKVEVVDLRGKFNIFELMGPKSSQVIKGTLNPILDGRFEEISQVGPVLPFHKSIEQRPLVLGWATGLTMPRWVTIWYGHWSESSRPTT